MKIFAARFLFIVLSVVSCQLSVVLATAHAQAPPNPQPCKNPQELKEDELVSNYLVDESYKPPIAPITYDKIEGRIGDNVTLPSKSFSFTVDFSKVQAVFGASNSDYLEGNFQQQAHLQTNILGLDSQNFNQYFKANQKLTPSIVIGEQKANYVKYVYEHSHLPEASNKYTDIEGQGDPKTIYDLVAELGLPDASGSGWENYWLKIPTAWSEFYKAEIHFLPVAGDNILFKVKQGEFCPLPIDQKVNFIMPDFYRTTAISDQINRNLVAKAAQSYQEHGILAEKSAQSKNTLNEFFSYCWKLLTTPATIAKDLLKTTSHLIKIKSPFAPPPALAADQVESCIKQLKKAKTGRAPYCPLPQDEYRRLQPNVSCTNVSDEQKLEKDNPNVVCTFTFQIGPINYTILEKDSEDRVQTQPECKDENDKGEKDGIFVCFPKVYVIPDFRIPWISAIWNNTLYSENEPGVPYDTPDGRPGIYTYFIPQAVSEELFPPSFESLSRSCRDGNQNACERLDKVWQEVRDKCKPQPGSAINIDQFRDEIACFNEVVDNTLPGQGQGSTNQDTKQRFIGATCPAQDFVDDNALTPKAIQDPSKTLCDLPLDSRL